MSLSPSDPSSFSRPDIALLTHADINWEINFEKEIICGRVELHFDILVETEEIILDARDLNITNITNEGKTLRHEITDTVKNFGSKLLVKLDIPSAPGSLYIITVEYCTAQNASALQWLKPEQTSSKTQPYLFSQCQPNHARSLFPCQDSPAVKFTYNATVKVPDDLTVLMSALRNDGDKTQTKFRQPVPIPSYLLAIAVGDLHCKRLGPRSVVWSELPELDSCAWEFAETERYLKAAEDLCGEYVWSEYNLLVLPPSFPYGGMENPCLTFVSPTLLSGDRSQADVIVHEIMHSWSGNLVTNRNFEHFWLNEGFTVFLERKVAASLIEDANTSKLSRDFESILGLKSLNDTISNELGATNPLSKLVVELAGVHPDDAFSTVPYEKGSLFLRYVEDLVGGPAVFDDFLRAYLNRFKMQSIDTTQFREFLLEYFAETKSTRLDEVDWQAWLHQPGMPPIIPKYDPTLSKLSNNLVDKIYSQPASSIKPEDIAELMPHQIIYVLQSLSDRDPLPVDKVSAIGERYKFNTSHNSEIIFRWYRICIKARDTVSVLPGIFEFLNKNGRMKYVRPLYRELYGWEEVRKEAIDNFLAHEAEMMHVVSHVLRKDLHLTD